MPTALQEWTAERLHRQYGFPAASEGNPTDLFQMRSGRSSSENILHFGGLLPDRRIATEVESVWPLSNFEVETTFERWRVLCSLFLHSNLLSREALRYPLRIV